MLMHVHVNVRSRNAAEGRTSSKKRTPPIAFLMTFMAFLSVQPTCSATIAVRAFSCSHTLCDGTTPIL